MTQAPAAKPASSIHPTAGERARARREPAAPPASSRVDLSELFRIDLNIKLVFFITVWFHRVPVLYFYCYLKLLV